MEKNDPIGVFDSGMGGLSVAAEIRKRLPHEDILYFGDSAHAPYGTKTKEEIQKYCQTICDAFMEHKVKAIVIACNTATSAAAPLLRQTYPVDIVGMEPALKVAASLGEKQHIAVWATTLTLQEEKFARLLKRFENDHQIEKIPCPKLVEVVEKDQLENEELVKEILMEYLKASNYEHLDSIVLGCTHFVFFSQILKELTANRVKIVNGNEGTVRHLEELLARKDLLRTEGSGSIQIENSLPSQQALSHKLFEKLEEQHEENQCMADI